MADVGPGIGDFSRRRPGESSDRGQLIIVSALGLAILFVTLALILNTAIYTENLASRSSDIGGGTDAVRYHDAASQAATGLLDHVNAHNHTSHRTLQSNLSAGIDAFRNHSSRLLAGGDRAVETTLAATVNGTRIEQPDGTRNFTNTTAAGNWTVVSGVDHSREFTINATRAGLDTLSGRPFTVVIDNGSATWRMNITRDGNDIVVRTEDGVCRVTADSGWVNVTAESVGESACPELHFSDAVTGPYDISYENASRINGTYRLIVDQETLADSPGPHLVEDGAGQPFAAHAIYSANVSVDYETARLFYNSTIRIAPGEANG